MAAKNMAFVWAYVRNNIAAALEYRTSLLSQVLGMLINDILWVAFWVLYFTKFPVVKGWTVEDILVLWAIAATVFGIVMGFTANAIRIPQLVVQGQLDYYLALPKNLLLHLLVSNLRLINIGDVLFGPLLLVVMVKLTWAKVLIFIASSILGAAVMLGFFILAGSLAFYLGNSDALSGQMINAVIHFSTYPASIFDTGVKVVLFTLIPAGFVTTIPVELMREWDTLKFLWLLGGAVFFLGLAVLVFNRGLKRYESGNLMVMRT